MPPGLARREAGGRPSCRPRRRRGPRCRIGLGVGLLRRVLAGLRGEVSIADQRAFGHRALDAALDGLMMQPERPTDCKKRQGLPDRPAISAPARPGLPVRFAIARSISTSLYPHLRVTIHRPPPRCHDTYYPAPSWLHVTVYRSPKTQMNPALMPHKKTAAASRAHPRVRHRNRNPCVGVRPSQVGIEARKTASRLCSWASFNVQAHRMCARNRA